MFCVFYCSAVHRDLHVLTPACPTRRSPDRMPGLDFSSLESLLKVNGESTRQASMVSYIYAFYALFVVIILISPLILLMRPPRKQAGEQPVMQDRKSTRLNSSH